MLYSFVVRHSSLVCIFFIFFVISSSFKYFPSLINVLNPNELVIFINCTSYLFFTKNILFALSIWIVCIFLTLNEEMQKTFFPFKGSINKCWKCKFLFNVMKVFLWSWQILKDFFGNSIFKMNRYKFYPNSAVLRF